MWFRDKLGVVSTTIIITIQITTLHCVPSVSRNVNNAKKYKDTSPESSMYKAYNFPEIEFPHESSLRDPLYSGRNLNTNPFNTKGVSSLKCKACNDLKKDMRMKRKLDRIHESHKTNIPNFSSDPVTIKLTGTDMFPEVKYPLNAIDTWEPHYWDPSIFNQKEEQYVPPDFPIFNPKVSDKGEKASRSYKKQTKSKAKQFMEDIDLFNEKMRSSRSQSQKTIGANNEKNLTDTHNKNSESFKQPESNDINVLRIGIEAMSNKTTEVNRDDFTYECLSNATATESRNLNNLILSQVNSTMTKSPLLLASKMECNNLEGTPIPIPYKVFENNNFSLDIDSNNVKDKDMNTFTDGKNVYVSNEPPYLKTHDVLDEDFRSIILNTTNSSQQQPDKIANINDHMVTSSVQENDTIATKPNDDPLNVKIPLPVVHTQDNGSMKNNIQLSRSNTNEHTHANIIVIPIGNSSNKKQIQIVDSNTGSPIIVFLPTTEMDTKTTITSDDTLHSLPSISETVPNNAFGNLSKISDVDEPLKINITDHPGNISENMEMPNENVLDIPCTTVSDIKLLLPDFEMLPNNSMCNILLNEANSTDMTVELYNATESSDEILSVIDIPFEVDNLLQNYTHLALTQNNMSLTKIDTDDIKHYTSLPEVAPTSHAHTDTDKTARLLAVSKLIDLILKDLVKKDPFMLIDKILPGKSLRDMISNVEELPASNDIVSSIQDTMMPHDIQDSATWSEKSNTKNNVTKDVNALQQNQFANITKHIPVPTQNENSASSDDIRDNLFSPFSMTLSDKVVTPLISTNIESIESLASSEDMPDIPLTNGTEDNKSLPLHTKLPDSLLTDEASHDPSQPSDYNESLESIPHSPQPSDSTRDIEFPLSITDRFVSIPLISNDNESFDSLPGYEGSQESPLNDKKIDDVPSPMSMNFPESVVTDKQFDDAPLLSSDDKSLHSLPDYEELNGTTFIDHIADNIPLSLSRELSESILTDEASNSSSCLRSLPIYETLIGAPHNDTIGVDIPLPLSENLSDGIVNTVLTSSDIEGLQLLPGYVPSSMELPGNLLTNEAYNDTTLTFNHNGSVESIPANEVLIETPVNDVLETDISLLSSTKLPDTSLDTPLTISNIESLESLPDYEELTGNSFSDSVEDDSSLSSSLEVPFNLFTNKAFLDTSSSNSGSLELIGSSLQDDDSLPWSIELPDRFDNTLLKSDDIEGLESLTHDEELVGAPLGSDIVDDMSLPQELLDALPVQLHHNNDETISESHSTDILDEGAFMEPDILSTENDKRLLARNTIPNSQESNTKEDKVLLVDKITNDLNDQIPVDKKDTNEKSNNKPESEAVKELISNQLSEMNTDDRHLYDDSPLENNRISKTVPTSKTKELFGDLTSSNNNNVPVLLDEQQLSSEVLYTSIVKYLYDAV